MLRGCSVTVTPSYLFLLFGQKPTTLLLSAMPPLRASAIRMSTIFFWTQLGSVASFSCWVVSSVMKPSHGLLKHTNHSDRNYIDNTSTGTDTTGMSTSTPQNLMSKGDTFLTRQDIPKSSPALMVHIDTSGLTWWQAIQHNRLWLSLACDVHWLCKYQQSRAGYSPTPYNFIQLSTHSISDASSSSWSTVRLITEPLRLNMQCMKLTAVNALFHFVSLWWITDGCSQYSITWIVLVLFGF